MRARVYQADGAYPLYLVESPAACPSLLADQGAGFPVCDLAHNPSSMSGTW